MSFSKHKYSSKHHTRKRICFPWEVAIYSRHSASSCRENSLKLLKHYKIPATKITVFIQDGKQEKQYKKTLKPGTYNKLVSGNQNLDTFVNEYYDVGTPVIHIQDDVKEFIGCTNRPISSLVSIFHMGFQECQRNNAMLWGLSPHCISTRLKPIISTELKLIPGLVWGGVILGPTLLDFKIPEVSDYERTIQYYKRDSKVVRLNFIAAISAEIRSEIPQSAKEQLARLYPEYVNLVIRKQTTVDIELRVIGINKELQNG